MHKYNSLTGTITDMNSHKSSLKGFSSHACYKLTVYVSSVMKVLFRRRIDGSRLDNHVNTTVNAFDGGMVSHVI